MVCYVGLRSGLFKKPAPTGLAAGLGPESVGAGRPAVGGRVQARRRVQMAWAGGPGIAQKTNGAHPPATVALTKGGDGVRMGPKERSEKALWNATNWCAIWMAT